MKPTPITLPPILVAVLLLGALVGAVAEEAPAVRVRGEITAVQGQLLTVRTRAGETVRVAPAPDARILAVLPAELAAIAPGSFVGTAAVPGPGGRLRALEVVVFPEEMRGAGEGHYAWDLAPESTMTNATVLQAEAEADGRVLTLHHPAGETIVVVPPEAPVVTFAPGDASLLRPGAHVFVPGAVPEPDGTLAARTIAVGRDGLVPPM